MGYYIPDDMWESLAEQPKTVQNAVFGAVARLFFTGEEDKQLTGVSKSIFVAFRDRVKKSRVNESNRKGKKTGNENENETDNEIKNETYNETDNEMQYKPGTETEGKRESAIKGGGGGREDLPNGKSKPPIPPETFAEIVGYLNAKTGKRFKAKSEATCKLISARMAEGYEVADFKAVIDNKCAEWLNDPKMDCYLKPETLFAKSHFEGYLNQRNTARKAVSRENPYAGAW